MSPKQIYSCASLYDAVFANPWRGVTSCSSGVVSSSVAYKRCWLEDATDAKTSSRRGRWCAAGPVLTSWVQSSFRFQYRLQWWLRQPVHDRNAICGIFGTETDHDSFAENLLPRTSSDFGSQGQHLNPDSRWARYRHSAATQDASCRSFPPGPMPKVVVQRRETETPKHKEFRAESAPASARASSLALVGHRRRHPSSPTGTSAYKQQQNDGKTQNHPEWALPNVPAPEGTRGGPRMSGRARRQRNRRRRERATQASKKALVKKAAALGKRGAWQEAIFEVDSAIRGGLSPDAYVYGSCVGAAAHSGRWREAMDLLRRMRGEGIVPTTPVFNAAIKACSKGGKLKLALALLDDMCAYGAPPVVDVAGPDSFRPSEQCGNSCLGDEAEAKADVLSEAQRRCRGGGGGVGAEDRFSPPDIQTFNTVMSACGRAGQWELALEMMKQAKEQCGLRLTRVTYNTAIAACGRSGQTKRAAELLTEMREAGVAPDAISFNSAIAGYAKTGRWKKALSLLREMESSQGAGGTEADAAATIRISPDEFSYSSAIVACGKGGKWSLAVGLLDTMRRKGIRQSTVAYNAAIKACGEAGQWERGLELLREMQAVQTGGPTQTAQADGSAPPAERLAAMVASVPFPDTVSYNAAIKACGDAGEWEHAVALLEEMRRRNSANKTCAEDSGGVEGERLDGRCDAAPQVGVADPDGDAVGRGEADSSPSRLRPSPDATSYSMAVSACSRAGNADGALGLLEVMRQDGFSPDSVTFASAIAVCGRGRGCAHEEAPQAPLLLAALIDRMRSSTVPSSAPCYARALEACADAGLCERGRSLMDDVVAAKVGVERKSVDRRRAGVRLRAALFQASAGGPAGLKI